MLNNVQADFLRNGSGKVVMSMSKDDSTQMWDATQNRELHLKIINSYSAANKKTSR
jgi:hypothetical protein